MFLFNIQGMNPGILNQKWKTLSLEELIISTPYFIPFAVITESHLTPNIFDAEVQIKNYNLQRADRAGDRKGGGVVVYSHDSIAISSHEIYSDKHSQAVILYSEVHNLIMVGLYRPPEAPLTSFANLMSKIQSFVDKHKTSDIIIQGDVNFPQVVWSDSTIKSGKSTEENQSARILLDFMDKNFMTQQVEENTRDNKNILDVIITNNTEHLHSITVEKCKITSDHDLVKCDILNIFKKPAVTETTYTPDSEFDRYNWNKATWNPIREELNALDWEQIMSKETSVANMSQKFEDTVISVASKHTVEHKLTARREHNRIPSARLALIRKKKRINSKINWLKYMNPTNKSPEEVDSALKILLHKKEHIETEIKLSILEEQSKKEQAVLEKIKTNPKAFYSYSKQRSKVKSGVGPLKDPDGNLTSDPKNMADLLQAQYKKVFSDPQKKTDFKADTDCEFPGIETIDLQEKDFITAINLIPPSAASGPDKFPIQILKECKNELAKPLCLLWKRSLETGEIPSKYKQQTIVPIFKKGTKGDPANYRPVSLTSHIIKIFERIVRKKLVEYCVENNIIVAEQYGFCSGKSCTTQLLSHFEKILEILDNNANADVIYLDFSKAFDKVDHDILLKKLKAFGITGNLLNWLNSFLSDREQYVIVDGHKSIPEKVLSGVPQGTVLGPLLFILYINDIVKVIRYSYVKIFADDSKLIKMIESLTDRELLDSDLQAVIEWAVINKMELNRLKFQLLSHGNKNDFKLPYDIDENISLEKSENVVDLGVTLSENATFTTHIANAVSSAKRFAAWTMRTFKSRSREVVLLLYKTYVRPRLEYGCAVWSPHLIKDINAIESIQRSITSKIEGCENMNYWERLQELRLYSLQRRRERYQVIHMWKIFKEIIPNDLNFVFYESRSHGIKCRRPKLNLKNKRISTLRDNYFTSVGPALFNAIPSSITSSVSLSVFKSKLDKFLKYIPDTPPLPNYASQNHNSILEWKTSGRDSPYWLWKHSTQMEDNISAGTGGPGQELAAFC